MTIPIGYGLVSHKLVQEDAPFDMFITYGVQLSPLLDGDTMVESLANAIDAPAQQMMTEQCSIVETRLKVGPQATGATYTIAATTQGAQGGVSISPNVATLVQKRTALGGRKNRGRLYWPGASEGYITSGGTVDIIFITDANAALALWLDDLENTRDLPMVILHEGAQTPTPVTSLLIQSRAATQRRRLRR